MNEIEADSKRLYVEASSLFEQGTSFVVMARERRAAARQRMTVQKFVHLETKRLPIRERLSCVLSLLVPGIRSALLLAVCNLALQKRWSVSIPSDEGVHVVRFDSNSS